MDAPSYRQTRSLVLITGVAVLAATALVLRLRAQNPDEVIAVILFLPVFVAAVLGGIRWGVAVAVVATLGYFGIRWSDIQLYGWSGLTGSLVGHAVGYLVFGAIGGWASGVVAEGITKLDRFDVTDDDSELLNARGVHRQLEQEVARARRYGSDFAVVTVTFDITGDKKATRHRIGEVVRESVRTVDDSGRITVDGREMIIAVLPETPRAGAEIVGQKVSDRLGSDHGDVNADVAWLTHPEDDEAIDSLLATLEQIVRLEHPEAVS